MNNLIIFPYSGSGIEVLDSCGDNYHDISFISDDSLKLTDNFHGHLIKSRAVLENSEALLIAVHGSASSHKNRLQLINELNVSFKINWETVIHPSASISKYSTIGKNVFIGPGVSIGPNVTIQDHVIILANSTVHHDSVIKTGSIICGNVLIAGNVTIESEVYVGAGSTIKNGIRIGEKSLIGMASALLCNVEANEVYFGNPAKRKSI